MIQAIAAIPGSIHSSTFRMISSCSPMDLKNRRVRQNTAFTGFSCPRRRSDSHLYMPSARHGVTSRAAISRPRMVQKEVLARRVSISFISTSRDRTPSREATTTALCSRVITSLPVKAEKPCISIVGRFTISATSSAGCQWFFSAASAFLRK